MRYLDLPKTDMKIAQIVLGSAEFGLEGQAPGVKAVPTKDAFRLMDEYVDMGGNFIDTAHVYSDWVLKRANGNSAAAKSASANGWHPAAAVIKSISQPRAALTSPIIRDSSVLPSTSPRQRSPRTSKKAWKICRQIISTSIGFTETNPLVPWAKLLNI